MVSGIFKDLVGQKFGSRTVISFMGNGKWLTRCDCGYESACRTNQLKGVSKCLNCVYAHMMGRRFGMLVYIGVGEGRKRLFRCDCGNTKVIAISNLIKKKDPVKSCGCLRFAKTKLAIDKLIGTKFNALQIVKLSELHKRIFECRFEVKCDCGNVLVLKLKDIYRRVSCGCIKREYGEDVIQQGEFVKELIHAKLYTDVEIYRMLAIPATSFYRIKWGMNQGSKDGRRTKS